MTTRQAIVIGVIAALGFVAIWLLTSTGMQYTPDSYSYITLARNLRAGEGYTIDGAPNAAWPPLFPLILLPFEDPALAARWINALCGAATLALMGTWMARRQIATATIIGTLAAVFTLPGVDSIYHYIWSESLFVTFILAFIVLIDSDDSPYRDAALAVLGVLATMQRYLGIVLVVAGALELVLRDRSWRGVRRAVCVAGPAILVLAAWSLRNYHLTHRLGGSSSPAQRDFTENTLDTLTTMAGWWRALVLIVTGVVWDRLYAILKSVRRADARSAAD